MTTDLSYVVKQSPAAPKLPILPVRRMVPLEPNIINALVSAEVWRECPFQLGRARKGTFRFPPIGAQQAGSAMSALEERHRSIERPEWARSSRRHTAVKRTWCRQQRR
jgi:hypothetical protein